MSADVRIATLIEPVLAPLVLDEVKVTPAGRRRVVRIALDRATDETVVVDTASEPMSLDEIAEATRAVSAALDESDVMGQAPYTLEVTSAGVGRPLTRPRHYQRGVGRLVVISSEGVEDLRGRIIAAGPESVTVRLPATKKTPESTRTLPYADIVRAHLDVEFSRPDDDTA